MTADCVFTVELVYATETRQFLRVFEVVTGTTVIQAVTQSGLLDEFPELPIESTSLGIFNKVVEPEQLLKAFDRIEVYRGLVIDAKQARRNRAAKQKSR